MRQREIREGPCPICGKMLPFNKLGPHADACARQLDAQSELHKSRAHGAPPSSPSPTPPPSHRENPTHAPPPPVPSLTCRPEAKAKAEAKASAEAKSQARAEAKGKGGEQA